MTSGSQYSDGAGTAGYARPETSGAVLPAWDLPTRLFKWTLVLAVANAWATTFADDPEMIFHRMNGYLILILLVFRFVWGIVGARSARFASFVRGPRAVITYLRHLARGESGDYLGHNPAGGAMILALLALCLVIGLVGLLSSDGVLANGPFAEVAGDRLAGAATLVHKVLGKLLLAAISVHVAANLYYQFVRREPIITAMITGVKPYRRYRDEPALDGAGPLGAFLSLAIAVLVVLGGVFVFSGTL